jgi:Spy/CpxP family protein refolding chaperone
MRTNRWSAALLALLLFGCGVVAGALGHRYYTATSVSAKSAEDFRHRYVSEMESRLKLTPSQVTQLEAILDDTKAKFRAVREASRPAMLKIKAEQIARVKSILTPQQIPAYEQLVAEREHRAHEQEERESKHGK